MSNTKVVMSQASNQYVAPTFIEDVFSTYLYTGNSSTQTITNDIDLAGEGGLVWIKSRSNADPHLVFDTDRGVNKFVNTNTAAAEQNKTGTLTSFNADGFSLGSTNEGQNFSGLNYASWTFRKAPRFFDVVTYTGNGASQTISHNLGAVPGVVIVKDYSGSGNSWTVYHRSIGNTGGLLLNDTNSTITSTTFFNDTDPTDTAFTVGSATNTNASGRSFVAYLFAHDPLGPSGDGSDGLIDCGSFSTPVGSGFASVELGWEPQFVIWKSTSSTGNWVLADEMRGTPVTGGARGLFPNVSNAEDDNGRVISRATGFDINAFNTNTNHIYIAIRRGPMRAPTSGTEVFAIDSWGGTAPTPPSFVSGFPVDFSFYKSLENSDNNWNSQNRMTGSGDLAFNATSAEISNAGSIWNKDYMAGIGNNTAVFSSTRMWMFRRAPEFFDVVAYTGAGSARTVSHNLGVVPEMIIVKNRSSAANWSVYLKDLPSSGILRLNQDVANKAGDGPFIFGDDSTLIAPTDSVFTVGGADGTSNTSGQNYIAYLFATLAGVSKVGSYTGNGTSQTINCGFTTGARFILIKRTDSSGDWYVWDTARGIIAGNDPFLELNTTAAEVTTDDSIDPASSGFIVNQTAVTDVNVNAASYIFYAVA